MARNDYARSHQSDFIAELASSISVAMVRVSESIEVDATFDDLASSVNFANAFANQLVTQCSWHAPTNVITADDLDRQIHDKEQLIRSLEAQKQSLVVASDASGMSEKQSGTLAAIQRIELRKTQLAGERHLADERLNRLLQPTADGIFEKFALLEVRLLEQSRRRRTSFIRKRSRSG